MTPSITIPPRLATKLSLEYGVSPRKVARLAERFLNEARRLTPEACRESVRESAAFDDSDSVTQTAAHAAGVPYSDAEWAARQAEVSSIFAEAVRTPAAVRESAPAPAAAPLVMGSDFDRRLRARIAESLSSSSPAPAAPAGPLVVVTRTPEEDREYRWAHRGERWAGLDLSPIQDLPD